MPEIFADQHAETAEAGVKSAETVPPGKIALFVEKSVGRQVYFSVEVNDLTLVEKESAVEEAVVGGRLDKADGNGDICGELLQPGDFRRIKGQGNIRHKVLEEIAGQGEFRKDDQVCLVTDCRGGCSSIMERLSATQPSFGFIWASATLKSIHCPRRDFAQKYHSGESNAIIAEIAVENIAPSRLRC